MKIFLDTSSLFKLYHQEIGSIEVERFFSNNNIEAVFLSEITKLEFISAVWKKVRQKDLSDVQALELIQCFESDFPNFIFVQVDTVLVELAKQLLASHGKNGLRTLDSIQLATGVLLKPHIQWVNTSDTLLHQFFISENLPV